MYMGVLIVIFIGGKSIPIRRNIKRFLMGRCGCVLCEYWAGEFYVNVSLRKNAICTRKLVDWATTMTTSVVLRNIQFDGPSYERPREMLYVER